jgi:hypothetical protein
MPHGRGMGLNDKSGGDCCKLEAGRVAMKGEGNSRLGLVSGPFKVESGKG